MVAFFRSLLAGALLLARLCLADTDTTSSSSNNSSSNDNDDSGPSFASKSAAAVRDPVLYGELVVSELEARAAEFGEDLLLIFAHVAKTGGSSFFSSLSGRPGSRCAGYQCDSCSRSVLGGLSMACGLPPHVVAKANVKIPNHIAACSSNFFCHNGTVSQRGWPSFQLLNLVHVHISDRLPEVLAEVARQGQQHRAVVLTLLRDPADRLVSEFHFLRQPVRRRRSAWNFVWNFPDLPLAGPRNHQWNGITLEQYLDEPTVWDYQFKFLTGHGFYEELQPGASDTLMQLISEWPVLFGVREDHDAFVNFLGKQLGFVPATYATFDNSKSKDVAPASRNGPGKPGKKKRGSEHDRRPIDPIYARPSLDEIDPALLERIRNTSQNDRWLHDFANRASGAYRRLTEREL
eukprot:INCI12107.2.p1 GENE.INCI12107.2~~INCI12107.2.p1  ORF type:complete len:405 (+),score=55.74 INCI12107.2:122-1336(+)